MSTIQKIIILSQNVSDDNNFKYSYSINSKNCPTAKDTLNSIRHARQVCIFNTKTYAVRSIDDAYSMMQDYIIDNEEKMKKYKDLLLQLSRYKEEYLEYLNTIEE